MVSKITSRLMALAINSTPRLMMTQGQPTCCVHVRNLGLTSARNDLMEFFDEKKNWGEREVKVGRSWKVDELRLKSNTDLHKLWYVLLKEKNMLLTMEADAKVEARSFPNPERIDKVEESMENLEAVVRERNQAYFLLETGKTGERSGEEVENWLGLPEYKQYEEYPVPKEQNREWFLKQMKEPKSSPSEKTMYFSMLRQEQKRKKNCQNRYEIFRIMEALKLYPNADLNYMREKFPSVDEDQLQRIIARVKDRNWENNVEPLVVKKWKGRHVRFRKFTWKRWYGYDR